MSRQGGGGGARVKTAWIRGGGENSWENVNRKRGVSERAGIWGTEKMNYESKGKSKKKKWRGQLKKPITMNERGGKKSTRKKEN